MGLGGEEEEGERELVWEIGNSELGMMFKGEGRWYLASRPLAWFAAFVAVVNFFFDLVAEFGVGVFVAGGHGDGGGGCIWDG